MNDFEKHLREVGEVGFVERVNRAIVHVSGLPGAHPYEVVLMESGETGQVLSLGEELMEILVFSNALPKVGTRVVRTGRSLAIPVGGELLGRTITPLGLPIFQKRQPVDVPPLGIATRRQISRPLETGVTLVDFVIPLAMGQRELVIGDRKIGKTLFAFHVIRTQAKKGVVCIYAAIGKRKQDIKKAESVFREGGVRDRTVVVASSSEDAAGIIYLTPYTAMALAEHFRDEGQDVLVVLDDMTAHAKYYREIALLAKRFPGRGSYPGDIFFAHSRLLERAGNFAYKNKEVSITCLPIAETVQGDLAGYIQTNLMSMTDGHIFFDSDLFDKGRRPAVNTLLSVTRVGFQVQTPLLRSIGREVTKSLAQLERMQTFVHFGAEMTEGVRRALSSGEKLQHFFEQFLGGDESVPPLNIKIVLLALILSGAWSREAFGDMDRYIGKMISSYERDKSFRQEVDDLINASKSFQDLVAGIQQKGLLSRAG